MCSTLQCGFFKRHRPQYPIVARDDSESRDDQQQLASAYLPGKMAFQTDSDEISSDDNEMMIRKSGDSLPIVVPQHSAQFIHQQQQKAPYPY